MAPCAQLYSLATATPPPSPRLWAHTRGRYWSLVSQDRRHLFVTPWSPPSIVFNIITWPRDSSMKVWETQMDIGLSHRDRFRCRRHSVVSGISVRYCMAFQYCMALQCWTGSLLIRYRIGSDIGLFLFRYRTGRTPGSPKKVSLASAWFMLVNCVGPASTTMVYPLPLITGY